MRLIRIYIYKYVYLSNINDWVLSADCPIYSPSSSTSSTRIKFFKVHPFSTIIRFTLRRAMMMRTIQKICTNVKFIAENTTWNEFVVILKFPLFINPTFSPIFNDVKTAPLCQERDWGELKNYFWGTGGGPGGIIASYLPEPFRSLNSAVTSFTNWGSSNKSTMVIPNAFDA